MWIFTFWEGPKPAYISLCHKSLLRQNAGRARIYDYSTLPDYLQEFTKDPFFHTLCLPHQADIIRVMLLEREGGMWVDSDFIHLNPMWPLVQTAERQHKLLYYAEKHGPTNGVLAAPPSHLIVSEWAKKIRAVYSNFKRRGRIPTSGEWTSFGQDQMKVLLPIALEPHQDLGWDRVQLIDYYSKDRFFRAENVKENAWPAAYGYMLFNSSGIPDWFRGLTEQQILNGPWLISYLFRLAFQLESHASPEPWTDTPHISLSSGGQLDTSSPEIPKVGCSKSEQASTPPP